MKIAKTVLLRIFGSIKMIKDINLTTRLDVAIKQLKRIADALEKIAEENEDA